MLSPDSDFDLSSDPDLEGFIRVPSGSISERPKLFSSISDFSVEASLSVLLDVCQSIMHESVCCVSLKNKRKRCKADEFVYLLNGSRSVNLLGCFLLF